MVFCFRYPYLAVVLNFSQTWALYCLVQFYSVIKDKLAPINPLAKFLTFKSIVFLTWWQGIAVAFLFSMGAFQGTLAKELKTRIQDYIICIEVWPRSTVSWLWIYGVQVYGKKKKTVSAKSCLCSNYIVDTKFRHFLCYFNSFQI